MCPKLIYAADFETIIGDDIDETCVWSSALCEIHNDEPDKVIVHNNIDDTFHFLKSLKQNTLLYYHNLKFDGMFWLSYLPGKLDSSLKEDKDTGDKYFPKDKYMPTNSFKYLISSKGLFYSITIKFSNHMVEIRDSFKLLPFKLKIVGQAFKTKYQKLDMDYTAHKWSNEYISDEEMDYIKNDVLVLAEALRELENRGMLGFTIGSECLKEYKALNRYGLQGRDYALTETYRESLPNLYKEDGPLCETQGGFIVKSYKGGLCLLKEGCAKKVYYNGITLDVNSLYPFVMHSMSGNTYPIGKGYVWEGNHIPGNAWKWGNVFFVRIKCIFHLKPGKLPFVQIKGNFLYNPREHLKTSYIYNKKTGKYQDYITVDGKREKYYVELTLTNIDYVLMLEHYYFEYFEILGGIYFQSAVGIFDNYIDKYMKLKMEAPTPVDRQIAKLMQNNLYGKFAMSRDSSFKYFEKLENGKVIFDVQHEEKRIPGYIAIGSMITSYARDYIMRKAQANYDNFIYCDTDSLHLSCPLEDVKDVPIDDKVYGCFKCEKVWETGWFVSQKRYIEIADGKAEITCAGLPDNCKKLVEDKLNNIKFDINQYEGKKRAFMEKDIKLEDFREGFVVPGKLKPKVIKGGVVLVEEDYEIR